MQYSHYVTRIQNLLDEMDGDSDISAQDLVGAYLDLSGRCESAAERISETMGY
jgi:putative NADH-flavin reductase